MFLVFFWEIVPCLLVNLDRNSYQNILSHLHRSNGYISITQLTTQCKEYRASCATTEAVSWQRLV